MSEKLELICPECQKTNSANIRTELHCKYCKEELTDKTYVKEPKQCVPFFTSIVVGTILGGAGTVGGGIYLLKQSPVNEKTTQNNTSSRYPIDNEYIIINSCISEDQRPLQHTYLIRKKEICTCALNETQRHYDFSAYSKNELGFFNTFEKNVDNCMEKKPADEALPASAAY